jgi:hypothetical protein
MGNASDLNRLIGEAFRDCLTSWVWRTFWLRRRDSVEIDGWDENLWDAVADGARRFGEPATLLTTYDPIGAGVSHWIYSPAGQRPPGRRVEYVQGHPSGGGTGYVGTIDGVEVFTADVEDGHSYLFSALMLESVSYRLVTPDAFVSVEFDEGDDPWSGTIVVRFAQDVRWHDIPVIDLISEDASADEEAPTAE